MHCMACRWVGGHGDKYCCSEYWCNCQLRRLMSLSWGSHNWGVTASAHTRWAEGKTASCAGGVVSCDLWTSSAGWLLLGCRLRVCAGQAQVIGGERPTCRMMAALPT